MPPEKLADILEEWSEVPVNIHVIIEYEMAKGKVRISPYDISRLPIEYLPDYS